MSAAEPVETDPTVNDNGHPDLQRLLADAQGLTGRLHRLALAVGLTQEFLAQTLDGLADTTTAHTSAYRDRAEHARMLAAACRELDSWLHGGLPLYSPGCAARADQAG